METAGLATSGDCCGAPRASGWPEATPVTPDDATAGSRTDGATCIGAVAGGGLTGTFLGGSFNTSGGVVGAGFATTSSGGEGGGATVGSDDAALVRGTLPEVRSKRSGVCSTSAGTGEPGTALIGIGGRLAGAELSAGCAPTGEDEATAAPEALLSLVS